MIVTIITVVKNDIDNIEKTINSVLCQNCKNIEYIVIDGNSTDGTWELIKKNKKKISQIYSGEDKNLYFAINKGIDISNGDVIGLLHSGDVYANINAIKDSIELMKKKKLDFVISNLKIVENNKVYRHVTTSKFFKPYMLSFGIQPPHPTLFIKSKVIKKLKNYSTKYKVVGDFDLFCKIFKNKELKWDYLNRTTVFQTRGGLSDGKFLSKLHMARDMSKILKNHNFISFKVFFIVKLLLRIKERIQKNF